MDLDRLQTALAKDEWVAAPGLYDPLTAEQAKRLADLRDRYKRKIVAIVLSDEETLLSADARAALVAALQDVDLVATSPRGLWRKALAGNSRVEIFQDFEGERARSADFVRFVIERHGSASNATEQN